MTGTDGLQYTVLLNPTDLTQPPTSTINLLCKAVPPKFYIGAGATDKVTGPVDMEVLPGATDATPVIHAWVVQVPFWIDKGRLNASPGQANRGGPALTCRAVSLLTIRLGAGAVVTARLAGAALPPLRLVRDSRP